MTNKEWLATLPTKDFYDQYDYILHGKATMDNNSRLFMIEWLDKEHTKEDEWDYKYEGIDGNYYDAFWLK